MTFDEFLNELIRIESEEEAKKQIRKVMPKFGIEGTEDKIKSVYNLTPTLRDFMLAQYYKIVRGK